MPKHHIEQDLQRHILKSISITIKTHCCLRHHAVQNFDAQNSILTMPYGDTDVDTMYVRNTPVCEEATAVRAVH